METQHNKYMRHLHFGNPGKLAMAEHVMYVGHSIKFIKTCRLDRAAGYVDHMSRKTVEIRLHPSNCNRDGHHAKSNLPAYPQTHLGPTTQELRLGTAIFELHSLTQLICILQA